VVTLGSDRGGRTQIKTAASGVENREVFERVTRGLREVTQRADQTTIIQRSSTWLDQHDTIASFVAAPLVAFLSVATALLAVWFATLLVQFDDPARIGIYGSAFSMMVLVVGRAIWLGRWAPPPFDLSRNRPAGKPGGPAFVQRDIAIALVMLAIGLVVSVILAS
jgi:hypothetical protein